LLHLILPNTAAILDIIREIQVKHHSWCKFRISHSSDMIQIVLCFSSREQKRTR